MIRDARVAWVWPCFIVGILLAILIHVAAVSPTWHAAHPACDFGDPFADYAIRPHIQRVAIVAEPRAPDPGLFTDGLLSHGHRGLPQGVDPRTRLPVRPFDRTTEGAVYVPVDRVEEALNHLSAGRTSDALKMLHDLCPSVPAVPPFHIG